MFLRNYTFLQSYFTYTWFPFTVRGKLSSPHHEIDHTHPEKTNILYIIHNCTSKITLNFQQYRDEESFSSLVNIWARSTTALTFTFLIPHTKAPISACEWSHGFHSPTQVYYFPFLFCNPTPQPPAASFIFIFLLQIKIIVTVCIAFLSFIYML